MVSYVLQSQKYKNFLIQQIHRGQKTQTEIRNEEYTFSIMIEEKVFCLKIWKLKQKINTRRNKTAKFSAYNKREDYTTEMTRETQSRCLKRMSITDQTPARLIRKIQEDTNYKFWSETNDISIDASNITKTLYQLNN